MGRLEQTSGQAWSSYGPVLSVELAVHERSRSTNGSARGGAYVHICAREVPTASQSEGLAPLSCGTRLGRGVDQGVSQLRGNGSDLTKERMQTRTALAVTFGILALAACSSTVVRPVFEDPVDAGILVPPPVDQTDDGGSLFGDAAPPEDLSPKGTWTGRVFTPAGDIPVSGALVYLATKKPDPIPTGNYCDTCLQLEKSFPQAVTKADGSFELVANRIGKQFLIIQKGQFRRIVEVDVKAGDIRVDKADSTLPRSADASKGDQVPSILISDGNFDDIGATLRKLGITPTTVTSQSTEVATLGDATNLSKYHVVFLPCGSCVTRANPDVADNSRIKGALRDYVSKGGKVYVTDWKQGFVSETFPEYVEFAQARDCSGSSYTVNAIVKDQGLDDWLRGQGNTNFELKANYQRITRVKGIFVADGDAGAGATKLYQPKVWMAGNSTGSEAPQTLSFEYGCGRVLYSTYHTETDENAPLDPQEKALFYILFEVASTCVVDPVIPR